MDDAATASPDSAPRERERPGGTGAVCLARRHYVPRRPEQGVLHRVVRDHLETFLAEARSCGDGDGLPSFVERELREFLTCGSLARGFARFRCEGCAHEILVAFSCKGRGFCPSCCGRRMAERAAHLTDAVLGGLPVRQWVHADVAVPAGDRARLEHLCRYVLRPPLTQDALEYTTEGKILLRIRRPWRDGTRAIAFTPSELLEKLVAMIPRPRVNLLLYHGALGPSARLRSDAVSAARAAASICAVPSCEDAGAAPGTPAEGQSFDGGHRRYLDAKSGHGEASDPARERALGLGGSRRDRQRAAEATAPAASLLRLG